MCTRVIMTELHRSAKGRWNNVRTKEREKCVCELFILLSKILLRFSALLLSTLNECSLLSSSFVFLYIRCSEIRKFYDSIRIIGFHGTLCFECKDERLISIKWRVTREWCLMNLIKCSTSKNSMAMARA